LILILIEQELIAEQGTEQGLSNPLRSFASLLEPVLAMQLAAKFFIK
jgi:hypothetical protein